MLPMHFSFFSKQERNCELELPVTNSVLWSIAEIWCKLERFAAACTQQAM